MANGSPVVSVIIPARNEIFLPQTIDDLCAKARGPLEVIAILDGYWPERISEDKRVHYVHHTKPRGMRAGLNEGVELARGEFVMKLDAHCMVSEGFDVVLAQTCQPDWVCVPTRHRLDAENWCVSNGNRPPINYQFIDLSNDGLNGKEWREKNADRSLDAVRVADIISCQGSCYFMHKAHWCAMGLLDEERYGTFRKDPQEVMFKTWTSGGRCVRVKDAWYAHLHKGRQYGRMYTMDMADYRRGDEYVKQWWTDSAWDERQTIPLSRIFREKFSDMPGWGNHPWMANAYQAEMASSSIKFWRDGKHVNHIPEYDEEIAIKRAQREENELISICIPAMNRWDDLRHILRTLHRTARESPPVEIVVLDYNSDVPLNEVSRDGITCRRYEGRDTYHMAHARNLSVLASSGDYVLISSADIEIGPEYINAIREQIAQGAVWTRTSDRFVGCLCIRRDEFMAAGGFDERFEFYGKEDKDLLARLQRRGARMATVPDDGLSLFYTPWEKKLANYAPGIGRREMHARSQALYEENCARGVLVANEGREWGSWA